MSARFFSSSAGSHGLRRRSRTADLRCGRTRGHGFGRLRRGVRQVGGESSKPIDVRHVRPARLGCNGHVVSSGYGAARWGRTASSGCRGHIPVSGIGAARGIVSGSGAVARAATGSRAVAAAARTILGSTTTSLGPPTMIRCSTLSRRMSTRRRRPSIGAASITASRCCRPRAAAAECNAALPNRRTR